MNDRDVGGREGAAEPARQVSVLVVDDHRAFAESLALLIDGEEGLRVVGTVTTGEEAVRECARLAPDVVLLDLALPDIDGIEVTRRIMAANPATRVVLIAAVAGDDAVARAIEAGARGFVPKVSAVDKCVPVIRGAAGGRIVLPDDRRDAIIALVERHRASRS
ncbi:MAG TPA: response regulator transcription factor [Actinomycetota bacterium]